MITDKYIAVIGGSNVDITGLPKSGFRPNDSNPGTINISPGGVGRNIAENIARLGLPVKLLTVIGNDSFGDYLIKECRNTGIDMSEASVLQGGRTSIYAAIMNEAGELEAAVSDMKITEEISPALLSGKTSFIKEAFIVIADNNLEAETLKLLLQMRRGDILFDAVSGVKLKKRADLIRNINSIKLNAIEAEILSGLKVNSPASASTAAEIIAERSVSNIFITLGAEGAFFRSRKGKWFLEPEKISAVNTTGSGDAFMAGIAFGKYNNAEGETLLKCGMTCAGIAAESKDTVSPDLKPERLNKILRGEK
ncbi:MAG: carbohydrate kinase family protein [Spirochaetales bacterium]|nr:carbohydrate kinase family protein [Spirochaetales bacterium]